MRYAAVCLLILGLGVLAGCGGDPEKEPLPIVLEIESTPPNANVKLRTGNSYSDEQHVEGLYMSVGTTPLETTLNKKLYGDYWEILIEKEGYESFEQVIDPNLSTLTLKVELQKPKAEDSKDKDF